MKLDFATVASLFLTIDSIPGDLLVINNHRKNNYWEPIYDQNIDDFGNRQKLLFENFEKETGWKKSIISLESFKIPTKKNLWSTLLERWIFVIYWS